MSAYKADIYDMTNIDSSSRFEEEKEPVADCLIDQEDHEKKDKITNKQLRVTILIMGKEDKNPLGRSELHLRCAKQNALPDSNILELIKVGGMDLVMKKDRLFGRTVLHLACSHNASFDLISELVDFGKIELVMEKDNNGNTALHLACKITKQSDASVSLNVITKLIEIGGRNLVMEKNNDGYTALDIAFLDGASPEILAKLLSILSMNYERF